MGHYLDKGYGANETRLKDVNAKWESVSSSKAMAFPLILGEEYILENCLIQLGAQLGKKWMNAEGNDGTCGSTAADDDNETTWINEVQAINTVRGTARIRDREVAILSQGQEARGARR